MTSEIITPKAKIQFEVGGNLDLTIIEDPFFCRDGSKFTTRQDETRIRLAQTGYWFLSQFQLPSGLATLDLTINDAVVRNKDARAGAMDFFAAYDKSAPGILWHFVQNLVKFTPIGTGFLDVHSADLLQIPATAPGIRKHGIMDLRAAFGVMLEKSYGPQHLPLFHFTRHRVFGRGMA
jgi:hypothetical protein